MKKKFHGLSEMPTIPVQRENNFRHHMILQIFFKQ